MPLNFAKIRRVLTDKFWGNSHRQLSGSTDATILHDSHLSDFLHLTPALLAELIRTLWSAIFLVILGLFLTFNIQWSDQRWKYSGDDMKPLVDLGFKVLPETDKVFLADLFMLTLLVGSVFFTLFMAESNRARIIIVRRIFWLLGILLFFRTITLSTTTLPSPKNCTPVDTGSFWFMLKQGVHLILGGVKACTDNIYSGHTIFITTSIILFRVYCKYPYLTYYSYVHGTTGICLLVATRLHYTVDVLLAVFITYAVHSIYFFIVDLCIEKHFLHIRRAEERLGDKELYQRIGYIPNMFNVSLVGTVRWMDGLDIRFAMEDEQTVVQTIELSHHRQQVLTVERERKAASNRSVTDSQHGEGACENDSSSPHHGDDDGSSTERHLSLTITENALPESKISSSSSSIQIGTSGSTS
ncbi:10838_t:CDS:2 [Ambispora gerdemannii]|uniref:10838_t:CDS:1 n=1 Tax=Ambispora gerdemannii TaxID=144530 RepID=A0A9N8ZQX0_9GLOM|nr:10838_t:CDS:2 [Ambispora gerdemannii]